MRFVHQVMAYLLSFLSPIFPTFRLHVSQPNVAPLVSDPSPPPADLELQSVTSQSNVAPALPAPLVSDPSQYLHRHDQPPPGHPAINQQQLEQVLNHHHLLQNLHWDDSIMGMCFMSAIQIATCASHPQIPTLLHAFSLAIAVAFSLLCVAKFTSVKYPPASRRLKKVANGTAAAAFYLVTAIPLPMYLRWVVAAVSVVSFLAILLSHFL